MGVNKPKLTKKVIKGLGAICFGGSALTEALDRDVLLTGCMDLGYTRAEVEAARRARDWVADWYRYYGEEIND